MLAAHTHTCIPPPEGCDYRCFALDACDFSVYVFQDDIRRLFLKMTPRPCELHIAFTLSPVTYITPIFTFISPHPLMSRRPR